VETNLLTHQIATLIQELAHPEYQGEGGFEKIVRELDSGLSRIGSSVLRAGLSDYRKFYHEAWKGVRETLCPAAYHEMIEDRFRRLVF
jgi:hypothetical protein